MLVWKEMWIGLEKEALKWSQSVSLKEKERNSRPTKAYTIKAIKGIWRKEGKVQLGQRSPWWAAIGYLRAGRQNRHGNAWKNSILWHSERLLCFYIREVINCIWTGKRGMRWPTFQSWNLVGYYYLWFIKLVQCTKRKGGELLAQRSFQCKHWEKHSIVHGVNSKGFLKF